MGNEGVRFDLGGAESPVPVPLAHIAPFALGGLQVEPSAGRIEAGSGESRQLEPLVMQVLIALASSQGATLSRDDLIAACWQGRIVSDDAINRVISRLRRALDDLGGGRVRLETVPKVGYRLMVLAPSAEPGQDRDSRTNNRSTMRRPLLVGAGAIALAATVALGFTIAPGGDAENLRIGVEPVLSNVGDREASRFASDVTSDLARYAGAVSRIDLVDRNLAGDGQADLLVRVAVDRQGQALTARARLVDTSSGSVLWARDFRHDQGDVAQLRVQTAIGVAGIIRCGLERSAGAYDDASSLRLYFMGCDALEARDWTRAESFARQIVRKRPDVAAGLACLAMTILLADHADNQNNVARVGEARRYAQRALELDPAIGRAYIALAAISGQMDPRSFELLEQGIRADPEQRGLQSNYATHLFNAGYVKASIAPAQRELALDAASSSAHASMMRRLMAAGRAEEALAELAKAERFWPTNPEIDVERLRLASYRPDRRRALAEVEQLGSSENLPPLRRAELYWMLNPAAIEIAPLEREAEAEFARNPPFAWYFAGLLTRLDQTDRALVWLARAPRRQAQNQWSLLFWPEVAPLRRDPRFFRAMAELGLVELWLARGKWPDFCSEPGLRYDCSTEAAKFRRVKVASVG